MTNAEIEAYRQRLNTLTDECSDKKSESRIKKELTELAREVGASTRVLWIHPNSSSIETSDAATPELIRNIHQALQTASMVNMCRTATQNYEIAVTATKAAVINNRIAAAIAILSMLAAWVAVLVSK